MTSSVKRSRPTGRSRPLHPRLLISCEHGGNDVPPQYARLFKGAARVLDSHRGMDFGALEMGRAFAKKLKAPLISATTTRLLVDLNRSANHRNVFSQYSRVLTPAERAVAMRDYYLPYRTDVEDNVVAAVRDGDAVLHISSHSFTPVLNGDERRTDLGLLYDPRRPRELAFATAWLTALNEHAPHLVVRRNYPYRGVNDALVTHLRRRYPDRRYAGVELEVNQKFVGAAVWPKLIVTISDALAAAVASQ
jgi:predicted N-formylglutamate amidohydrolase